MVTEVAFLEIDSIAALKNVSFLAMCKVEGKNGEPVKLKLCDVSALTW